MPNLLFGGVEYWLLALLRHSQERLAWSVAVTDTAAIEPEMRRQTEEFASVGLGKPAVAKLRGECDVIIGWGIFGLRDMVRDFRGPVILMAHGCGDWTERFINANSGAATHFAAVSRAAATAFKTKHVTVIPNGVDPRRCLPRRPREAVRRQWGLAPHEIAVGFVGRLSPEKNPIATSQAVQALGPEFRAVYIGKGYGEDMKPAARALTPDAIFVPPVQHIGDALAALDCLIMASPAEGFSLALVESLVAGLPVVATPVGIVPDLRQDHSLSLCTVPIDPTPKQLAVAVRKAISPANRHVVEQARSVALANYTAEIMAQRWMDYLQSIIMHRA